MPEPSPPSEPGPGQGPDVPSPDPRGPETPDQPIDPDPPLPTEPAEVAFRGSACVTAVWPRAWIRPWKDRRRAPCGPLPRPR